MDVSLLDVFVQETIGTGLLTLLGVGVVANVLLARTKGNGGGWLLINFGWGLAVFAGVFAAWQTGAHINPAVTIGILTSGADHYDPNGAVEITVASTLVYLAAEFFGAFLGAVLAWLAYRQHYDEELEPALKLGTFATGPNIRSYGHNVVTEAIATFVLIYVILVSGNTPHELGPLWVALLVVGIGASLGGPTGYAINPARDLGPRIAHALLPIKGKGSSDWAYSWVPIVGPLIGAALGGLAAGAIT